MPAAADDTICFFEVEEGRTKARGGKKEAEGNVGGRGVC